MDLLVTACLFVLSAAVVVIGIMLTGIAADIRRTRQALEKLGPHLPGQTVPSESRRSFPRSELGDSRTVSSEARTA